MEQECHNRTGARRGAVYAGVVLTAFFGLKLLACLHLGLMGRVVPGDLAALKTAADAEPGGPVLYVYQAGGQPHFGWRRGSVWGGGQLSVLYSPLLPSVHFASAATGLTTRGDFWHDLDFIVRLVFLTCATGVGVLVWTCGHRVLRWLGDTWAGLVGLPREPGR